MSTTTTTRVSTAVRAKPETEAKKLKQAEVWTIARVVKGAELLDRKRPGWWRRVTLRDLDMADGDKCVLGQDFAKARAALTALSPYGAGCEELGIEGHGSRFGFDQDLTYQDDQRPNSRFVSRDEAYDFLKSCWAIEISDRRRLARARTNSK